jgi:SAM-dependent methyltransferase
MLLLMFGFPRRGSLHTDDQSCGRAGLVVGRGRLTLSQRIGVASERRLWDRRATNWDHEGASGLGAVVEAVLDACEPSSGMIAVDLGCGTGRVTIPLAERCERVLGIDVSPRSIERLRAKCAAAAISNIDALVEPIETLELPPGSVDLVVSNYALHHLRDGDKTRLLSSALSWLRPGGRLVVGDMMFGRGGAADDRRIVAGKLQVLMRRGPAGWWRILKNLWRFGLRLREKPLSRARWETLARGAGFTEVRTVPLRAEASLLVATRDRDRAVPDVEPTVRVARPRARKRVSARAGTIRWT